MGGRIASVVVVLLVLAAMYTVHAAALGFIHAIHQ